MDHQISLKSKSLVLLIVLFIFSLVILNEYLNGGVVTHHLLHRADLPGISNWWGYLLLPIVTIITLFEVENRLKQSPETTPKTFYKKTLLRLLAGMAVGILLCILFLNDSVFTGLIFPALGLLAFFIPLLYTEYWLGFVLGCMYVLGVFIPFLFGAFFMLVFWAIFKLGQFIKKLVKR
jgi:hypothetical protein